MLDDESCVSECPSWYWTVQNGRCVEESWRLATAIEVPAAVAIIAVVVVVMCCVLKQKNKG